MGAFTIAEKVQLKDGLTISQSAGLGATYSTTYFFLGKNTSISRESYDVPTMYWGEKGCAVFLLGENAHKVPLGKGDLLVVPRKTLCGVECAEGAVYTEIIMKEDIVMNEILKPGQALKLKDLISYEAKSIANLDIVKKDDMKFVLMAFDEGTGLTPHRAPGDAVITALEGSATIGYENEEFLLQEGESFRFAKNGLHSVAANGQFKMSLLLVIA